MCLEYNIKEGASWPEAAPLLFRLLCCWQECILFWQKKKRNDDKKADTHKKKFFWPFWNNNLYRDERGDISLLSMKNKTKACATPNTPAHLVGGNWIKNTHPEVKIVPVPVFAALKQRLLAIWHNFRNYFYHLGQYFTAAITGARVYQKGRYQ